MDEADDRLGHGSSRIAQQVQQLHLDPATDGAPSTSAAAAAVGSPANTSAIQQQLQVDEPLSRSGGHAEDAPSTSGKPLAPDAAAAAAAGFNASSSADLPAAAGEGTRDGGDAGWEVVASSKTAGRRHKRKQHKREQWQQAFEEEWQDHAASMQQQQQDGVIDSDAVMAAGTSADAAVGFTPAAAAEQQSSDVVTAADPSADAAGMVPPAAATAATAEQQQQQHLSDQEHSSDGEDDDGGHDGEAYSTEDMSDSDSELDETDTGVVETDDGTTTTGLMSSIATMTADFAMQNVMLQMGLRLLAKDGRQIQKLSRWALRCSACFTVTREMGRLFCPKCGNMTMDKVEVAVGPDGAEVYGVKKQHILRGTKYSLPKPKVSKGGRFIWIYVKRDHCTALRAVQHPSMIPTSLLGLGVSKCERERAKGLR